MLSTQRGGKLYIHPPCKNTNNKNTRVDEVCMGEMFSRNLFRSFLLLGLAGSVLGISGDFTAGLVLYKFMFHAFFGGCATTLYCLHKEYQKVNNKEL